MHLVEIFLPLNYGSAERVPAGVFELIEQELATNFGGVTAYPRAPAHGLWQTQAKTTEDDLVVFEVMAGKVDKDWWIDFRKRMEALFRQREVLIRYASVKRV
jgi:hypothetical protein